MIEKNTLEEVHEKFKGKILEDYETFRERGVSDNEAALHERHNISTPPPRYSAPVVRSSIPSAPHLPLIPRHSYETLLLPPKVIELP